MKKLHLVILFIVATICGIGCKKSTDNMPVGESGSINGTAWAATTYAGAVDTLTFSTSTVTHELRVSAYQGTLSTALLVQFGINNYTGQTGTYPISTSSDAFADVADYATQTDHYATTGTITITKASATNVQGSFSFATDSFEITNGKFNINLQ